MTPPDVGAEENRVTPPDVGAVVFAVMSPQYPERFAPSLVVGVREPNEDGSYPCDVVVFARPTLHSAAMSPMSFSVAVYPDRSTAEAFGVTATATPIAASVS